MRAWAADDSADDRVRPPTAQRATRRGRYVADDAWSALHDLDPQPQPWHHSRPHGSRRMLAEQIKEDRQ